MRLSTATGSAYKAIVCCVLAIAALMLVSFGVQAKSLDLNLISKSRFELAQGSQTGSGAYESPLALLLRSARRLIEIRQYDLAYQALSERADLYSGDTEFDYLLGIAALEFGKPEEAVLALERVLINNPGNPQARAEIGRAYLMVKEIKTAKRQFEAVARQKLPPKVKSVIAQYIDALSREANQPSMIVSPSIRIEMGFDNNVNVGSAEDRWLLADGTQVFPLPPSQPRKSAMLGIGGAINLTSPINGRVQWITGLRGMVHRYPSAHTLDQEQVDLSTGLAYRKDCHQFKMLGQFQRIHVDGDKFRDATGVVGQWQCDVNARRQVGVFAQRFELRFPNDDARDASRQAMGLSFAQQLSSVTNTVLLSSIQLGREYSRAGLENLSFDFTGFRMLLSASLSADWRGQVGINWEQRRFDGAEPLFGVIRNDRQTEVRLGLESVIDKHWTLQPQVVVTRNRSTLAPSDYRRTRAQLVAKYRLH